MAIIDLDLILYLTCHTGKYQLQRSIPKVDLSWRPHEPCPPY